MDTKVLTQDELNNLKNVRETFDNLTTVMGSLETQLTLINLEKNEVVEQLKNLKQQEIQLGVELVLYIYNKKHKQTWQKH